MPSPEPLKNFKYSPWSSVSTLAMFEPFFKYSPFLMALFVTFCAKADPTADSAPMLGERSLPKMTGPLQSNLWGTQVSHPQFLCCEQLDVCSFLLWCLFHSHRLLSLCSHVNWSKQEHHFHTNLRSRDECSWDSMYQQRASIFDVDFQKC